MDGNNFVPANGFEQNPQTGSGMESFGQQGGPIDFEQIINANIPNAQQQEPAAVSPGTLVIGGNNFKVDERYLPMLESNPIEAVYRTMQSQNDSLMAQHTNATKQLEEYTPAVNLFNQMLTDPTVAKLFIKEKFPELIPDVDPEEMVAKELAKEFGADFVPDQNEAYNPLSKSAKYFRKFNTLLDKYTNTNEQSAKSLKEYIENSAKRQQEEAVQLQKRQIEFRQKYNINDQEYTGYKEFINQAVNNQGLMISLYRMLMANTQRQPVVPTVGVNGGNPPADTMDQMFAQIGM